MTNIRIYYCENNLEGILTAVYDAWSSKYGHNNIKIKINSPLGIDNMELFTEYIYVVTDFEKAGKVLKAAKEKISMEVYELILGASCSDVMDKGDFIYRFLINGFAIGGKNN